MRAVRVFLVLVMFLCSPASFAQEPTTVEIPLINKTLTIKTKKVTYFVSFAARDGSRECAVGDAIIEAPGPIVNSDDLENVRSYLAAKSAKQCPDTQIHIISLTRLE